MKAPRRVGKSSARTGRLRSSSVPLAKVARPPFDQRSAALVLAALMAVQPEAQPSPGAGAEGSSHGHAVPLHGTAVASELFPGNAEGRWRRACWHRCALPGGCRRTARPVGQPYRTVAVSCSRLGSDWQRRSLVRSALALSTWWTRVSIRACSCRHRQFVVPSCVVRGERLGFVQVPWIEYDPTRDPMVSDGVASLPEIPCKPGRHVAPLVPWQT